MPIYRYMFTCAFAGSDITKYMRQIFCLKLAADTFVVNGIQLKIDIQNYYTNICNTNESGSQETFKKNIIYYNSQTGLIHLLCFCLLFLQYRSTTGGGGVDVGEVCFLKTASQKSVRESKI